MFGAKEPLSEPAWYHDLNSAYYKDTHKKWREHVRSYVDDEIEPVVDAWDRAASLNDHVKCQEFLNNLYSEASKRGILSGCVGCPWPAKWTDATSPEDYNQFHELITLDELSRGGGGIAWALIGGLGIGLPPVIAFGIPGNRSKEDQVIRDSLSAKKLICLAISEPTAGSDVANIRTTAKDCGDHYLVNGEKKWITNGIYADYITTAVRTGGPGAKGMSMLLIERSAGVETKKMDCMGVWPSGTTFITFTDVKVPKTNIIGKEGEGFRQVMYNFNHERWMLCIQALRLGRTCVEDSLKFARQRTTFGKHLIEHQVIQHKIAEMGRLVESGWAWLENITYQLTTMSKDDQNKKLGGHIALLKVHSSRTLEFCAREALQVFGGAGYTRSGKGARVERIYREVRAYAIPGGSEEIMLNLAVGQFKFVNKATKDLRDKQIANLKKEVEELKNKIKDQHAKL
eukprot:GEMP01031531.1.p1 GENE.GEMP01031531.1~~GEMP01031531.1.p1  ORF type:complete len:488 (+),score=83.94 GEMP01031531.1:96-1466(+)